MQVLFLSQPFEPKRVDSMFEGERDAALAAGFSVSLIDADALEAGDFAAATRKVSKPESPSPALYRGWMLDVQTYASLYEALSRQGLLLINTPEQYQHTHHLPDSYEVIRSHTPLTVWTTTGSQYDEEAIRQLLAPFGDAPIIVKDFVKSQKHYWEEACFIPAASDAAAVARVVKRFVELQGERLTGGLVFRAFVELEPLTIHARSACSFWMACQSRRRSTGKRAITRRNAHPLSTSRAWRRTCAVAFSPWMWRDAQTERG